MKSIMKTKFDIKIWNDYRKKASKVTEYIDAKRDKYGNILMEKKMLDSHMQEISTILKKCSHYLDKSGMHMTKPLWVFDIKNTQTHASAPDFAYGHLMKK